jgi:hypothetical protein
LIVVRLVNRNTGAIVQVADEKVARLGTEWAPVEESKPKPAAKPKAKS